MGEGGANARAETASVRWSSATDSPVSAFLPAIAAVVVLAAAVT